MNLIQKILTVLFVSAVLFGAAYHFLGAPRESASTAKIPTNDSSENAKLSIDLAQLSNSSLMALRRLRDSLDPSEILASGKSWG